MAMILKVLTLLRSLVVTVYFFVHTLFVAGLILVSTPFVRRREWYDYLIGQVWAWPILKLANIQVELRGAEHWPRNRGFLVLFNHTSWIDILVMVAHLPGVPRFGAKIELFSIPIFGKAMRAAGMLPIERHNRKKVLQIYKDAEARAHAGEIFALAPEGTRQVGYELGRFKTGPFMFAQGAQMPILPLVIGGAQAVMSKKSFLVNSQRWQGRVVLQILKPIETAGTSEGDIEKMQQILREPMASAYSQINRELGH